MKTFTFELDNKVVSWDKSLYSIEAESKEDAEKVIHKLVQSKEEPSSLEYLDYLKAYDDIEIIAYNYPSTGLQLEELV